MAAHAHAAPAPLGGKLVTPTTIVLGALSLIAAVIVAIRFLFGIGAVTNLNDGYPWGVWIVYDVMIGSALACGGFAMALMVYIFNRRQYHPLVRPALLASLFGYTLAGASIVLDLGRYWNFWHIFWPKFAQENSVMFELATCMTAYVLVMWIEFTPTFLERFGMTELRRKLNKAMFFFIALGVVLPTMHQSSLGSMVVIFGPQINPMWQTPLLPLYFLTTALAMGFSMVIFEATLVSVGFKRDSEMDMLSRIGGVVAKILAAFLVVRFVDIAVRGALPNLFDHGFESLMFWVEIALFAVSLWLIRSPQSRSRPKTLFLAAVAMMLAGSVYRINVYLIGYETGPGWHYFPSLPELMVTIGLISAEILGYIVFVRCLPILPKEEEHTKA